MQVNTGYFPYTKYPTAAVVLGDLPMTIGTIKYYNNYWRDTEVNIITNICQHVTNKTLKVLNYIEDIPK